jgi:hypothetical protein
MASHEPCDPTSELLRRLPRVAPDPDAAARVRRRCHAAMERRAALQAAPRSRSGRRPTPLPEAALILSMGLYLAASLAEAVRVASSL